MRFWFIKPTPSWYQGLVTNKIIVGALLVSCLFFVLAIGVWVFPRRSAESVFYSEAYRYRLTLPAGWRVTAALVKSQNDNVLENMTISSPDGAQLALLTEREASSDTLIPATPERRVVRNLKTWWYDDYDPISGQAMRRIVVERPDGLVNELRGYGTPLDVLLQGFTLN